MARVIKSADADTANLSMYEHQPLNISIMSACESGEATETDNPILILAQAREQAKRIAEEAYLEGLARGEAEGRQRIETAGKSALGVVKDAICSVKDAHEKYFVLLEPDLVELIRGITSRVLLREAACDRELIARVVRAALGQLVDRRSVVIRLCSKDYETIRAIKPALLLEFDGIEAIEVISSDDVTSGGCIIDSETLVVDATLDNQLNSILNQITQEPAE